MGTSLLVHPVAGLPQLCGPETVRMLWNREPSGCFQFIAAGNDASNSDHAPDPSFLSARSASASARSEEQQHRHESRGYRDVFHRGDCDSAAREFARLLGRGAELEALVTKYHRHHPGPPAPPAPPAADQA